ncbi:hypothetical protein [Paenisporosarcina sp. NPDC076898]|uniref:hypothetical protein n=1 Tax=unclassified Paenisporosarcina TaxID=2642018 RepID=UPI003D01C16B
MFIAIFFYIMAPLLSLSIGLLGISMINGKFVKEVEKIILKPNKFGFNNILTNLGPLIFGIFVIIVNSILPNNMGKIITKIIYVIIGLMFIVLAILMLYMIITEGNSIISDVKNNLATKKEIPF